MAHRMSAKTQAFVEKVTGMSVRVLQTISPDEQMRRIQERAGRKLVYGREPGMTGRGSVALELAGARISEKEIEASINALTR